MTNTCSPPTGWRETGSGHLSRPTSTGWLVVERELDRCLVVNHDPVTGEHDEDLLHRLRPGVLLGHGARVQSGGRLRTGGPAGLWQG